MIDNTMRGLSMAILLRIPEVWQTAESGGTFAGDPRYGSARRLKLHLFVDGCWSQAASKCPSGLPCETRTASAMASRAYRDPCLRPDRPDIAARGQWHAIYGWALWPFGIGHRQLFHGYRCGDVFTSERRKTVEHCWMGGLCANRAAVSILTKSVAVLTLNMAFSVLLKSRYFSIGSVEQTDTASRRRTRVWASCSVVVGQIRCDRGRTHRR